MANVDCRDSRMALGCWQGVLGEAHGYCLLAMLCAPKTFVLVPKAYAFFQIGSLEYGYRVGDDTEKSADSIWDRLAIFRGT
jgi:hypothetical protein